MNQFFVSQFFYLFMNLSDIYCEKNACWVIFLRITVNPQQNDANITVICCSYCELTL